MRLPPPQGGRPAPRRPPLQRGRRRCRSPSAPPPARRPSSPAAADGTDQRSVRDSHYSTACTFRPQTLFPRARRTTETDATPATCKMQVQGRVCPCMCSFQPVVTHLQVALLLAHELTRSASSSSLSCYRHALIMINDGLGLPCGVPSPAACRAARPQTCGTLSCGRPPCGWGCARRSGCRSAGTAASPAAPKRVAESA